MKFDLQVFLNGIQEKKVYYFSTKKIPTDHYYVCITKTNKDLLILTVCTSNKGTMDRLISRNKLNSSTIVYIKPDKENPFTIDTFINCNDVETVTIETFGEMYKNDAVNYSGEISNIHYELSSDPWRNIKTFK